MTNFKRSALAVSAAIILQSSVSFSQSAPRTVDVKSTDIVDIICETSTSVRGTFTMGYWLSNDDTSLTTTVRTSEILTEDDKILLMTIALSQNYTAAEVMAVGQHRCEQIAKEKLARIRNVNGPSFVRFHVDQNLNVRSFEVLTLTREMKFKFTLYDLKVGLRSTWNDFLKRIQN